MKSIKSKMKFSNKGKKNEAGAQKEIIKAIITPK